MAELVRLAARTRRLVLLPCILLILLRILRILRILLLLLLLLPLPTCLCRMREAEEAGRRQAEDALRAKQVIRFSSFFV